MPRRLALTELRSRLASRELSAREAVQCCLARMEQVEPELQAFLSWDADDALAQADAADRELTSGAAAHRPLLGVPIALKDVIAARGQPLTCGSNILRGYTSPYDATAVERLRAAGGYPAGPLEHGRVRHGLDQ
jgi:aspartyl-tRNA(Asn)/glutamyl-tRNA(Gln) amidotransferase subunit A